MLKILGEYYYLDLDKIDEYIQIKKGLSVGAQIVTGPYAAVARELKQGTIVNLVTEEEYYESDNEK